MQEIKYSTTFSETLHHTPGLVGAIVSVLSTLYLYSWICGKLKDSVRSPCLYDMLVLSIILIIISWQTGGGGVRGRVLHELVRAGQELPGRGPHHDEAEFEVQASADDGLWGYGQADFPLCESPFEIYFSLILFIIYDAFDMNAETSQQLQIWMQSLIVPYLRWTSSVKLSTKFTLLLYSRKNLLSIKTYLIHNFQFWMYIVFITIFIYVIINYLYNLI